MGEIADMVIDGECCQICLCEFRSPGLGYPFTCKECGGEDVPPIGSRWVRSDNVFEQEKGNYNAYTVIAITNTAHIHERHPQQVVYKGDNGFVWSLPLKDWPGKLNPEKTNKVNL